MSAPSANAPNDGIVAQIGTSLNNAVKYVSETIQGNVSFIVLFTMPYYIYHSCSLSAVH